MQEDTDEVIEHLKEAITPVLDGIEADISSPRAVLVIAGREFVNSAGEYQGIRTFVDCVGDVGTIGEALYTELIAQIEDGNVTLFNLLREVVKTVEQEKEIAHDQPLDEVRILH